jgi:hypothetical protein
MRESRQEVEMDLAAAYNEARVKEPLPERIDLHKSNMAFVVKKPGEWKKGWTLSKKQLQEYLLEILPGQGEQVVQEIIRRHEPKLMATDYSFELKSLEDRTERTRSHH